MKSVLCRFFADESGAVAIEYALIAGIVSVSIVVGLTSIKDSLSTTFNSVAGNLTSAR